jgi:hypothetical protein
LDGTVLVRVIKATFRDRNTKQPSDVNEIFSDQFIAQHQSAWSTFIKKEALDKFAPDDFEIVVKALRLFLLPPLMAINQDEPFEKSWEPGESWRPE